MDVGKRSGPLVRPTTKLSSDVPDSSGVNRRVVQIYVIYLELRTTKTGGPKDTSPMENPSEYLTMRDRGWVGKVTGGTPSMVLSRSGTSSLTSNT